MLEAIDEVLTGVDGGGVTASEAIEQLLGAQIMLRNNRRLQAAMRSSRLPAIKTLDDFDFSFQPSIKREQIDSLHELGQTGAMLFFQLINRRYERASTVLTSNKGFEEWGQILGDEVMAAALIDRLLHHCHIVNIR